MKNKLLVIFFSAILIYIVLIFISLFYAGIGYGIFSPMKFLFPFSMIFAIQKSNINTFELVLAFIQVLSYALLFTFKPKWKNYIITIHILAVIIVFYMNDNTFN